MKRRLQLLVIAFIAAVFTLPIAANAQPECILPGESYMVNGHCACVDPGDTHGPPCHAGRLNPASWQGAALSR